MKGKNMLHLLLLAGMALMIPCYLFTVGNVVFSPWPLYERSRAALFVLTALCTAGLYLALRRADRASLTPQKEKRMLAVFAAAYFAVQLVMAHALRFEPKTDLEQCFTAAQQLVDTGTFAGSQRSFIYFTRYPFNLGLVYLLAAIFRFFGLFGWADRYMQAALVCSLLFTAGVLCAARICRRAGGVCAQSRLMVLCASCLPFLYCTSELYTDAFSMSFPVMSIYACMRLRQAKTARARAAWAAALAAVSFAGAQIRLTSVIAVIACVIVLVFERRGRALLAAALALAVAFAGGSYLTDSYTYTHLSREDIEKYELPRLHHIAMGLPIHEDEGYGQYGDGGWLLFSTSFDDPAERDAALMREIIDRVYYLRYPNRLLNMLSRKNLSTFGTGTFVLNEIIESDAHEPDNAVKQVIFWQGRYHDAYYHLTTALFMAQMLLACAACAQAVRRKNVSGAAVFIALVGIFIVLCMWETRGRYFFQYQLLLLCAAALFETSKSALPD